MRRARLSSARAGQTTPSEPDAVPGSQHLRQDLSDYASRQRNLPTPAKGGTRATLTARCLTNGKNVTLYDGGRAEVTEQAAHRGFTVQIGTIQCKIAAAAVAQGVAEFVDDRAEFGGE